jgi:apolipoprotein N-acyltransferase
MISRIADGIVLLWGWRRAAVAAFVGALAALAQAPFHAFPILWLSLPVLVLLLDGAVTAKASGRVKRLRPAFAIGWFFGVGYFLAGLWWIAAAFLVDVRQFGWMIPFALMFLAGGLALFMGLGTALARMFWSDGPARVLALAVGLTVSEYLRGNILTGFPWNALGYGLAANGPMMQAASLVGLDGMTFLAVIIFAAPVLLLNGRRFSRLAFVAICLLFGSLVGFGAWRLATVQVATVEGVKLRVMQPAIDQWRKWRPEFKGEILSRYVELSSGPDGKGLEKVTHLIWPESAFPFLLANEPWALSTLSQMLGSHTTLLSGAIRAEPPSAGESRPRYYNSVYVIAPGAELLDAYDKTHLVPFGEYLPFQDILEALGIQQLTQLRGGFASGTGLRTLTVPGAPPVGPLICYEAIFPNFAIGSERPAWLLNVTNDGWFGLTAGPYQHLHQAQLRAVEEGLPLVRAANTGISAVFDPLGRVVASLPLGEFGIFDSPLPIAIDPPLLTRMRQIGLITAIFCAFLLLFARRLQFFR